MTDLSINSHGTTPPQHPSPTRRPAPQNEATRPATPQGPKDVQRATPPRSHSAAPQTQDFTAAGDFQALAAIADATAEKGNRPAAIKAYQNALHAAPSSKEMTALADAANRRGYPEVCRMAYEKAIATNRNWLEVVHIGDAAIGQGQTETGKKAYAKAMSLTRSTQNLNAILGVVQMHGFDDLAAKIERKMQRP